ncbi:MAG TPA: RNA polymerase factor sigma-54, partial [Pseudohaliea sp.]|nr:RNA polymerase factor sigma-54 [Pseudohaliea sp.]
MKQALQLKLGQQLTMTPQLQQAIKLLQLSTLDLQLEIQQVLQSNPMLELDEGDDEAGEALDPREPRAAGNTGEGPLESLERTAAGEGDSSDYEPAMPEDLPVDTQWEDLVPSSAPASAAPAGEGSDYD